MRYIVEKSAYKIDRYRSFNKYLRLIKYISIILLMTILAWDSCLYYKFV